MTAETELKIEHSQSVIDVFKVWGKILNNHREITKIMVLLYSPSPHGKKSLQVTETLPRERVLYSNDSLSFYGQTKDIKAIGAAVEIKPLNFDPEIDYSGADRWFNEGAPVRIDPERYRSFIFTDFESPPDQALLKLTLKSLTRWKNDWYLLDSGGSYHLIIDKLIVAKDLPEYYGQLIIDMAKNLSPVKNTLYTHIGEYLIRNSADKRQLGKWADDVLDKFSHIDDPIKNRGLVFPIDLRYVAHVVKGLVDDSKNDAFLRISEKHGSVPVLSAEQNNNQVIIYQYQQDPFNRHQPLLPNLKNQFTQHPVLEANS